MLDCVLTCSFDSILIDAWYELLNYWIWNQISYYWQYLPACVPAIGVLICLCEGFQILLIRWSLECYVLLPLTVNSSVLATSIQGFQERWPSMTSRQHLLLSRCEHSCCLCLTDPSSFGVDSKTIQYPKTNLWPAHVSKVSRLLAGQSVRSGALSAQGAVTRRPTFRREEHFLPASNTVTYAGQVQVVT